MTYTPKESYGLAVDTIDQGDIQGLIAWLQTNPWLTQGELVKEFEASYASWLGTDYAVMVNSGSSANLLMYATLLASGELANQKVVVPAISWATTVAPALQLGFDPIMCDAEPHTFGLDPNRLEEICREHRPSAVILVHVLGMPCDLEAIKQLQARYEFKLMEDSCAATGSKYDKTYVGNFGDLSSFSFFFGHHISTIEGGMVCTNSHQLYLLLLQLRSHGWAKDLPADLESFQAKQHNVDGFNRPFTFYHPGFNVRSSDLNARIGLGQMEKLDEVVSRRVENHALMQQLFDETSRLDCQHNSRATTSSIAFAALAESAAHRDEIAARLKARNIETRPLGGGNMSRQPFWRARYPEQDFIVADDIASRVFQLPTHPAHSLEDIRYIYDSLLEGGPSDQ